ncbi:Tsi3 family protein [Jannaschia sp. CCS1]|uniref:Tsi3 family protein n=1 Tax=Jannaschia sp. (strain CCS1) TaxID=290400 RepID=UPI000053B8B2|nr:Tsi3 family protein [Jannaschia sp. CCS1]ABD56557.1 hypothetical protein Jann_3640 [Jannaschia sp. CCS1]
MVSSFLSRRALIIGGLALATPAHAEGPVTFASGLLVDIPRGFAAQIDGDLLRVSQTEAVRAPLSATLRVDPHFSLHRTWVANRVADIRFTVRDTGGAGSGGPVHELRARRQLDDGTLLALIAYRQAEGAPDFEIALDLLSSVRRLPE